MRKYREEEHTTTFTRRIELSCHCDWCGEEIVEDYYEDIDTNIEFTNGYSYPDNGSCEGWEIEDLCIQCGDKLKDALIAMGITVKRVEREW